MEKVTMAKIESVLQDERECQALGLDYAQVQADPQQAKQSLLLKIVLGQMEQDDNFSRQLANAQTTEERYNLCKDFLDVPFAEFQAADTMAMEAYNKSLGLDDAGAGPAKLSDEALDMVTGGSKAGAKKFGKGLVSAGKVIGEGVATLGLLTAETFTIGFSYKTAEKIDDYRQDVTQDFTDFSEKAAAKVGGIFKK